MKKQTTVLALVLVTLLFALQVLGQTATAHQQAQAVPCDSQEAWQWAFRFPPVGFPAGQYIKFEPSMLASPALARQDSGYPEWVAQQYPALLGAGLEGKYLSKLEIFRHLCSGEAKVVVEEVELPQAGAPGAQQGFRPSKKRMVFAAIPQTVGGALVFFHPIAGAATLLGGGLFNSLLGLGGGSKAKEGATHQYNSSQAQARKGETFRLKGEWWRDF